MLQAATASIPQTRYSEKISVPWWNAECDCAIKNKACFTIERNTKSKTDNYFQTLSHKSSKDDAGSWGNFLATLLVVA